MIRERKVRTVGQVQEQGSPDDWGEWDAGHEGLGVAFGSSRDTSHDATGKKAKHASTKASRVADAHRSNDGVPCDQSFSSTSSIKGTVETRGGKEVR